MNVHINDLVSYDSTDHIATITINRPERMNALNEEIITGCNKPASTTPVMTELRFCTPQAIAPFLLVRTLKRRHRKCGKASLSIGVTTNKPIIAAVHGWCIGGAYVIVQMCDMVIAADNTTFKYPEAQLASPAV